MVIESKQDLNQNGCQKGHDDTELLPYTVSSMQRPNKRGQNVDKTQVIIL